MRACIHRGSAEVGGSCLEVQANSGERLIVDLGLPLTADLKDDIPLPEIVGLQDGGDSSLLGLLLSHSHPDHYGLVNSVPSDVPLFMGAATARILKEASFFTPMGLDRKPSAELADRVSLRIGPFEVTPYLVDHSAFDAYALVIGADQRRLFYSGDLRAHGRKASTFARLLDQPPSSINALVLEGTTIGRRKVDAGAPTTEADVEEQCLAEFQETPGMALACYSAQNIDRLVSVYRAALRSDRDLVIDLYGAAIAAATGRDSIPQASWERVRVYVPQSQRVRVKETGEFWRVNELGPSRIFAEELAADPSHWVMNFRTSMADELGRAGCLGGAKAIWLMWSGYLDGEAGERARGTFDRLGIPLTVAHVSGHATVEDLQRLAAAINADKVIPIHTDVPQRFHSFFERVEMHSDGEWWQV